MEAWVTEAVESFVHWATQHASASSFSRKPCREGPGYKNKKEGWDKLPLPRTRPGGDERRGGEKKVLTEFGGGRNGGIVR